LSGATRARFGGGAGLFGGGVGAMPSSGVAGKISAAPPVTEGVAIGVDIGSGLAIAARASSSSSSSDGSKK
jgi:hypothetical protein